MKKFKFLVAAGLTAGLSFFVSCAQKESLPENPKDKQEYRDNQGNSWIYNAMLMRWALMPSGGSTASYYYYPNSGNWTNTSGVKVNPPSNVNKSVYTPSSKPNSGYRGSSKPSTGKSFGSSSKSSHSFGA